MSARIIMLLTSHTELGQTGKPTGFYWEELAAPYWVFRDAGHHVTIASIKGGAPQADPGSLSPELDDRPRAVTRFLDNADALAAMRDTPAVNSVATDAPDAVFLVGGHGCMWDFPANPDLAGLVSATYAGGGVVAAVCHGPAGLLDTVDGDGQPLLAGRRVTGFSNEEEERVGLVDVVPGLLQDRLAGAGAHYEHGRRFRPYVVADGRLVTGQNPQSSELTATTALDALWAG